VLRFDGGDVPTVVYTCCALAVGDRLVVPNGIDRSIAIATLSVADLVRAMHPISS